MTLQHPVYEILAKEIAYALDNPSFNKPIDNFLSTKGYVLNQSFDDPLTGFRACGLLPIAADKSPVFVFRGSNRAIDDIANNHPQGIGFNQFADNQERIAGWIAKVARATGRKPDIVGHGVGGAIAQIVATQMIDKIGEVVTFCSPGTSRAIAKQFLQNGGANLNVTHYIIDGDLISLAGEAFIAGKAILQSFTDCAIKPLHNLDKQQKISQLLSNPPVGLTQTEISIHALNHPAFTFFNRDYLEFLTAYYAINPEIAWWLTSRAKFEALRRAGFSLQDTCFRPN